jgi:hypothetical protein
MMALRGTMTDLFESILRQIVNEAKHPEEIIQIWVSLGKRMGIEDIFPAYKLVVLQQEDGSRETLAFIASTSHTVVEYLTSENIFHEEVSEESLRALIANKPVYH